MGCSGALFGLVGFELVELVITWKDVRNPLPRFLKLLAVILISLGIGLLPGLDNFAHIGGLIMGILLSMFLSSSHPFPSTAANICMWMSRTIAFILIIALYIVFLLLFFTTEDLDSICPNCKYLSCIPVSGWCDV
jgi:ABC-type amino acid transport system permease subunit